MQKYFWTSIFLILFVLAADVATKWWVLSLTGLPVPLTAPHHLAWPPFMKFFEVNSFINIVLTFNDGVSFSFLSGSKLFNSWVLIAATVGFTLYLMKLLYDSKDGYDALGFSLIIGGAIGNIIDRLRFGAVVDFIDVHWGGYHWPAFNVADSAIVLGVAVIIFKLMFKHDR